MLSLSTSLTLTALLTGSAFLPYVLDRLVSLGLVKFLQKELGNRTEPVLFSAFGERARRAHLNAIETFAPFAAVALIALFNPEPSLLAAEAAAIFFFARLVFTVCYWLGIPALRTVAFYVGFAAMLTVGLVDLHILS